LARWLAFEIQRLGARAQHECEKPALQLENALLRFERRLPSGRPLKERD